MTNEELTRTLREYADWADGDEWEVPVMLADHLRQAAEKLEQMPRWIPVEERLPEKGVDVLVIYPDRHTNMGTAGCDDWIDEDFEDGLITHWRPLPKAPGVE